MPGDGAESIAITVRSDHPDRDGIAVRWERGAWLPSGLPFRATVERAGRVLGHVAPYDGAELTYARLEGRAGASRAERIEWERTAGDTLSESETARATRGAWQILELLERETAVNA